MDFRDLKETIEKIELVDAHAHNLVAIDSSFQFVNSFSEATGDALSYAHHSLSFKRNLREISELYGTDGTLHAVEKYRRSSGLDAISSKCFKSAGISAVLIDDGLKLDKKHEIEWHRNYIPYVGRILRIERLAEEILDEGPIGGSTWTLDSFNETFSTRLKSVAHEIVGLKSVAAYRSGLEINTNVGTKDAEEGLNEDLRAGTPSRITNKNFIDYIFTRSLEIAKEFDLPLQIHTGFGDKDLDLRLCNPLHLRNVLEDKRFAGNRIVLLHASYPFSREASYLASVYPQIFLDFGLAVPKLSIHGMISSLKELLELAPTNKVMFSTDGYAAPETYYLGAKKSREVVFSVLRDACIDGDLSVADAIEAAKDIFARNSIQFYKIDLSSKPFFNTCSNIVVNSSKESAPTSNNVTLVRMIWADASGQTRCRVVPAKRFNNVVVKHGVGVALALMAMPSYEDGPVKGSNLTGVGEMRLMPDLSTKCTIPWAKQEEMVLADMHLKPGEVWEYCPRQTLQRAIKILKDEFDLELNAGFENEFLLLKKALREGKEEWVPFGTSPYCSTTGYDVASPIFNDIYAALQSLDIAVEQLHAEAAKGQYEMAMQYTDAGSAADKLILTREVVRAIARKHGLLATFVPKFDLHDIGSGCHVHLSLSKNGKNVFTGSSESSRHGMSPLGEEFMAGVLNHLPAILAITAPVPNSYDRIQPNMWTGAYLCWGKENREAPIRTACPPGIPDGLVSNFEIKAIDGCANPHIALAAILAAGMDGLRNHLQLPEPIDTNPDLHGATLKRLPLSLSESLEALEKDQVLHDLIGENLLLALKAVRKSEINHYSKHPEAYKELIHRY